MSDPRPSKTKRRWYQYSLRTLLLLITLGAFGLSYLFTRAESYKQQHQAAVALADKGVSLQWRPAQPAWLGFLLRIIVEEDVARDCIMMRAEHGRLGNEDLRHLRQMPHVERLYLARASIGDDGLEHIKELKHLKRLSLWGTELTDDGLRHLAGLDSLEVLDIHHVDSRHILGTGVWVQDSIISSTIVSRRGKPLLGSKCLKHLTGLENLKTLYFSFPVDDDGLAALASMPSLRTRALILDGVTDAGLANLQRLRGLEALVVKPGQFSSDGFRHFSQLKKLRRLWLERVQVSDDGWRHLSALAGLRELSLYGTSVQDADLLHIGKLAELEKLSLRSTKVTDDGIAHLAGLTKLRRLDLLNTPVTADCLTHLMAMRQLEGLGFQGPLDDEAVCSLARLPKLKPLYGSDRSPYDFYLTDVGLAEFGKLTCVQFAKLYDARDGVGLEGVDVPDKSDTMSDAGLIHLWQGEGLQHLDISGRDITLAGFRWGPQCAPHGRVRFISPRPASEIVTQPLSEGIRAVAISAHGLTIELNANLKPRRLEVVTREGGCGLDVLRHLADIKILEVKSIAGGASSTGAWENLRFVPNLEEFETPEYSSSWFPPVDAVGVRWIGEMKDLRSLDCRLSDNMSTEDLVPLGRLKKLEKLDLHCGTYTGEPLGFIAQLDSLRKLGITGRRRTVQDEQWLRHLADLPQLEELSLGYDSVSDVGMALIGQAKSLTRLSVSSSRVTDSELKHLDDLPNLEYVDVHGPAVTDEGVEEFRRRNPSVRVR